MSSTIKAVIIDDNKNRIEQIKSFLPDYIEFSDTGYGDSAKAEITGSNDGKKCNVVIMYGDDIKGQSVHVFDWLKNSGAVPGLEYIPVVILTNDEFSDRSMEIIEIGDCFFYEGAIEDDDFYSVVMDAIESYDDSFEEDEILVSDVKNAEKIMGMSYVLPSEPSVPQRAMVISDDDLIKEMMSSIETSKKETVELREIITKTYEEAVENGEELSWAPKTKEERSIPKSITFNEPEESFEYRKKKYIGKNEIIDDDDDEPFIPASVDEIHIFNDRVKLANLLSELESESDNTQSLTGNTVPMQGMTNSVNNQGGFTNQSQMPFNQMQQRTVNPNIIHNPPSKKRVFVVDYDSQTVETVKSMLGDACTVQGVDSPMKAIDYFVVDYADYVLIEYNLKSMNALQVAQSVKMQPGGKNAKVIVMLTPDEMQYYQTVSASPLVSGIIGKPLQKNQIETLIKG